MYTRGHTRNYTTLTDTTRLRRRADVQPLLHVRDRQSLIPNFHQLYAVFEPLLRRLDDACGRREAVDPGIGGEFEAIIFGLGRYGGTI